MRTSDYGPVSAAEVNDVISSLGVAPSSDIGQINGQIWPAAAAFARYVTSNTVFSERVLADRNIVELGAGTGVAGLAVARMGASCVTLTEHPEAMSILTENVSNAGIEGTTVMPLLWGEQTDMRCELVLAADCCYDPSSLEAIAITIRQLLSDGHGIALVVQEVRWKDIHNWSIESFKEVGLVLKERIDLGAWIGSKHGIELLVWSSVSDSSVD